MTQFAEQNEPNLSFFANMQSEKMWWKYNTRKEKISGF